MVKYVILKGKPPRHKLEVNGKQIAQWNLERGVSLCQGKHSNYGKIKLFTKN